MHLRGKRTVRISFPLSSGTILIFVYIDIIQYQVVGDAKAPLLRVIDSNRRIKNSIEPNENVYKKPPAGGGQKRIDNRVTPAASSTSNKSARILTSVSKNPTESRRVQTDEMNTVTLKRFESLINGPHSAVFCKIMDILTSG